MTSDRSLPGRRPGHPAAAPPASGDDVRWLFYTSGTTADPKGAQHTDRTIHAVATGMSQRLAVTDTDRNALAFPFTHIGGITWLFTSLMTGMVNILFEAFVPDVVVKVLSEQGVTLAGSGTAFHQAYLAAQRGRDTPIFPERAELPRRRCPQAGPLLLRDEGGVRRPHRVGLRPDRGAHPDHGVGPRPRRGPGQLRGRAHARRRAQAGQAGRHARPAVGEEGEIRAKAPQLMLGYLDPSLDADGFDEEGYFRTGDLGTLNERNMLTITGRLKDIIIRKGENVSAKEVEDLLFSHPQVLDVAVIGLPDPERGERVCAVVSTARGRRAAGLRRHGRRTSRARA